MKKRRCKRLCCHIHRAWLKKVSGQAGNCKDPDDRDSGRDQNTNDERGVEEPGVESQDRGVLDADFAVEDATQEVALLVFHDPRLIVHLRIDSETIWITTRVMLIVVLLFSQEDFPRT